MSEQVTLRFESTIESENSDPILLSGPIQLFETVDEISDLPGLAAKINDTSESELSQIVAFVKHIEDHENSQTHRGAYFLLNPEARAEHKSSYPENDWIEILLGTHSHANMESLENLSAIASTKGIVVSNGDNTFDIKSIPDFLGESGSYLPPFPSDVQEKLDSLKNMGLSEPDDSEWNHLDAELSELTDPYDWLTLEDGKNIAVGNCRELYRALTKADKKLYLTNSYELSKSPENQIGWLQLAAYLVDYDPTHEPTDETVVYFYKDSNSPTNRILVQLDLPWKILEGDVVLFFDESKLIESYKIVSIDGKKLILRLPAREYADREAPSALTVMVVRDCTEDAREVEYDIKDAILEDKLSLEIINRELTKLYMEGELHRRPNLPKLYLATDQYGKLHWENKLLPNQYFYTKDILIEPADFDSYVVDGKLQLVFKDAYFRLSDDFFPFLIIDGMLAGDNKKYIDEKSGKDLIYNLPLSQGVYDFDPNISHQISLVLIKSGLSGSLADEIADKYITKTDAISILSGGNIKLDDYATLAELVNYSKKNHLHSQYALKGHNHDYRYANFYHTHSEIFKAVAEFIVSYVGGEEDITTIQTKLEQLSEKDQAKYEQYLNHLLESAGFIIDPEKGIKYYDENVLLSDDVISALDDIIKENKAALPLMSDIKNQPDSKGPTVQDALKTLAQMFKKDTVLDSQVLLSEPLLVRLVNGPVGGISTNKRYDAGTSLQQILRDILNPQLSIAEMRAILIPTTNSRIIWYAGDSQIADPSKLKLMEYQTGPLYFKYELRNAAGEVCEYKIERAVGEQIQKPDPVEVWINGELQIPLENGKYLYSSQSIENTEVFPDITLKWNPNQIILDNYGIRYSTEESILGGSGEVTLNVAFAVNKPDFYIGSVDEISQLYELGYVDTEKFKIAYEKAKVAIHADAGQELVILVEEHELIGDKKLNIFDNSIDITEYFEKQAEPVEISGSNYLVYSYETFIDQDFDIFIVIVNE